MNNKDEERRYVTPRQAAFMYGFSSGYLANLRTKRRGPHFFKRGRKILYRVADLEQWVTESPVKTIDQLTV